MVFEWDEAKNRVNIAKHGLSFREAELIFAGPRYTIEDRRFDYGERRYRSIGVIGNAMIVAVVHTDRIGRIRIISARPASRRERHDYQAKIHAPLDD